MAISTLSGLVDDADILSNQRVVDMDDTIDQLETDVTQFTTALMKVATKPAHSSKVEWLEDRLFPRLSALAASATSAATTLSVTADTGAYFRAGDVVRIATTGEAVAVVSVSTDTLTVTRSIGSVAAATAASGVDLVIIGNAAAQGATIGTFKVTKKVAQYNYTQIFRHPYSFTNTLSASKLYGGPEPNNERRKKLIEHKRAIEYSLFFGGRDLDTGGAEPIGYMGGLVEFISSNIHDPSGQMTSTELDTFLQTDLQHGSKDKVVFASPLWSRIVSTYLRDNWVRSTPDENRFGIKVDAFVSGAYGNEIAVFTKKDWNDFSSTSSQYGSWAFVVDLSAVTLRPLRTTKLLPSRQANDADRITEEYLTEVSVQIQNEAKHAIIKNATS